MVFHKRALKILKHKVIYDGIVNKLRRILAQLGLAIKFYYVFKEGLKDGESKDFTLESGEYETIFLTSEDMHSLDCIDGRSETALTMQNQMNRGHKCLAIKTNGKIVGFTWCQFDMFAYPMSKGPTLLENEAYLYDMYILKGYRGRNLAPLLRYRCYQELAKMGRTVLYSASTIYNNPAIVFKKKLNARIVSLRVFLRIGKNLQWNWKLKAYDTQSKIDRLLAL